MLFQTGSYMRRIYFLRHGQSVANVATAETFEWDAPLSPLGHLQALEARESLRDLNISLIVVSPLTRALQTCVIALEPHLAKGVQTLVQPLSSERLSGSGDLGSLPSDLRNSFSSFDFSALDPVWWYTGGEGKDETHQTSRDRFLKKAYLETDEIFYPRLKAWKDWLLARTEEVIVVVGHCDITGYLTGLWLKNCELAQVLVDVNAPVGSTCFPSVNALEAVILHRPCILHWIDRASLVDVSIEDQQTGQKFVGTRHEHMQGVVDSALASFLAAFQTIYCHDDFCFGFLPCARHGKENIVWDGESRAFSVEKRLDISPKLGTV